jgi:hypothetical protein
MYTMCVCSGGHNMAGSARSRRPLVIGRRSCIIIIDVRSAGFEATGALRRARYVWD